jgi:hypothetical protein
MPLTDEQKQTLFALLEVSGWTWRNDSIYAPNDTMWLSRDTPWGDDVTDFYDRMRGRRARIENNRGCWDVEPAVFDVASLIAVLKSMQPSRDRKHRTT